MRYQFGDYEADSGRFVLLRDGRPVTIEPKPLQLLLHLLEQHPNTVTKDALLDAIWDDAAVTEGSLTRAVREVRRALRQRADGEGAIRTVRGRGYGIGIEVERLGDVPVNRALEGSDASTEPAAPARLSSRRLVAVLSADAVGYSRLLAEDEAATVAGLQAAFERMTVAVEDTGGRVVDTAGDNMLAEFPSAVGAVTAALVMQGLDEENGTEPERVRFRVGLHLGEVLADGERIYGDAVNIAARLESLAPTGGIAASASVVESVQGRLRVDWIDAGETRLKNIVQPIRAFCYPSSAATSGVESMPFVSLRPGERVESTGRVLSQLSSLDRLLLLTGLPFWLLCFSLSVFSVVGGASFNPIGVGVWQEPDAYPVVEFLRPFISPDIELQVGDRLLRFGEHDLRGVDALPLYVRFVDAAGTRGAAEVVFERAGETSTTSVPGIAMSTFWPQLVISPVFLLAGVLLLLRAPRNEIARAAFHTTLAFGILTAGIFARPPEFTWLSMLVIGFGTALMPALAVRFLLVFPHGRQPAPRIRAATWLLVLLGPLHTSMIFGFPFSSSIGFPAGAIARAVTAGIVLTILGVTFVRSSFVERRQLKWVLWSAAVAIVPVFVAFAWTAVDPRRLGLANASQIALLMLPLGIFISIARYDLFDIDRLISATVSCNILLVVAVAGLLLVAPPVSAALADVMGVSRELGTVSLAVVLALLTRPAYAWLRPWLEQAFFPSRRAFDVGAEGVLRDLAGAGTLPEIVSIAAAGIDGLACSQGSALYARRGDGFEPLFGEREDTPNLRADSALAVTLREAGRPLVLHTTARGGAKLDPFDRATLEKFGAEVVVPVSRGQELQLILCVGAKQSRDVYTPTDVALLSSIAYGISSSSQRVGALVG